MTYAAQKQFTNIPYPFMEVTPEGGIGNYIRFSNLTGASKSITIFPKTYPAYDMGVRGFQIKQR